VKKRSAGIYHRGIFILLMLVLFWCGGVSVFGLDIRAGAGMGTQIHYSKNTFKFAPGVALHCAFELHREFDLDFCFLLGALMGNSIRLEPGIMYNFQFGNYLPKIGLHFTIDFGSVVFHAESSEDIVQPTFPEVGFCLTLRPAYFRFSRVNLSFVDISVGTDMFLPGRVLLLSFELIHIDYRF
jgi:hypothetical protein